ncbi:YaiI/YqxD family protein [Peribacillus asahii]|uniref:YaiI/YqxD family protein n=1 Tax=Peribacillus asahii TaxID=228899 RepID=UPI00382C9F15
MEKDVEFNVMDDKPSIYVDADACPVKKEILDAASLFKVNVTFVASYKNMMSNPEGKWVYVDADKEAADLYIVNAVKKGDIVITNDIGLAGTLLPKVVYVLSSKGKEYTEENISMLLDMRYLSAKMRRAGKHTKGPKAFSKEDRIKFAQVLAKILSNLEGI